MQKFTTLTGVAAPLPMINVDTDMIIPKLLPEDDQAHRPRQGAVRRDALHARRQGEAGFRAQQAGLPQGADPGRRRQFRLRLVPRARALGAARFRHPLRDRDLSFADIFYNNCFKNGILPIKLPQEELDKLMDDADRGANATLSVDLEKQEIRGPDGGCVKFDVDPFRKHCLLNGLDDIGLTHGKEEAHRHVRDRSSSSASPGCTP